MTLINKDLQALTHLGDVSVDDFLRDYWQKRPLLIRGAFPDIAPVDKHQLAGFSLEAEIDSRLLVEQPSPDKNPLLSDWQLRQGPFTEQDFTDLPASHWTLLVQAVDQLVPEAHALLHRFRFLPNWRVDDLMVSYATDGGSVGPHFDYYDVFLVQAEGQRRWQLGQQCSSSSPVRQDTDLKILTQFDNAEEWVLNPGDMLYIPPNLAHWGIALGESLTYSIGFRAPSASEILLDFSEELSSELTQDTRYSDAGLLPRTNPGLIDSSDLKRLRGLLDDLLVDDNRLADWFGRYMTQDKRGSITFEPSHTLPSLSPSCRAAYRVVNSGATIYLNGEHFHCSIPLAQAVCAYAAIDSELYGQQDQQLIQDWQTAEYLI